MYLFQISNYDNPAVDRETAELLEFTLARGRTPPRIPASSKKETRKALELLLQKKDLRAGNADSFLSDIISKMNTGTDASG